MAKLKWQNYQYEIVLWFFILIYIIVFSYLSIRRNLTLQSNYYDLGIMHQVVYNTSKGRFLEMTNQDFGKNISRLAIHFDPILVFLAPFYKIYDCPETLLIIQSIVLGVGAWAIFLIGRQILKDKAMSVVFAVSYLLFFPVERANLFDFHPVTLATTFLLFTIYFSLIKKYWPMMFFVFLSLLTKEHVGLVVALFGGYLFFFRKERKFSVALIVIGLVFFVSTVKFIIPYFRQQSHFALSYFSDFGDRRHSPPIFLFHLLTAYGALMIFSPIQFLIAAPEVLINALSSNANMRSIYFHYNSLTVPFILLSAIYGFNKLRNSSLKKLTGVFVAVFATSTLLSIYYFNPLPFSFLKEPYWWGSIDKDKLTSIKKLQEVLDDQIKVATTPRLAPFFSGRKYYYNFLYDTGYAGMGISDNDIIKKVDSYSLADYIVIDRQEILGAGFSLPRQFYQHLLDNNRYKKIFTDKTGIEVYKKVKSS